MFKAKSVCILGRQPQLGLAELESLYGADHIKPLVGAALLDIPTQDINFQRLGGTIKTARILTQLPYSDWKKLADYLKLAAPLHLDGLPEGKFTLGLSVYGLKVSVSEINRSMLQVKKVIKQAGRSVRIIPNKTPALSSAQVLHNKLTHKGAWELLFIADGQNTFLAQTLFVQDIEAYAARDHARPARDPKIGMLPPKLAQIIINLSSPGVSGRGLGVRILDPFCGTGVILQEALLMGYSVIGTDIDQRMVEYTKANIQWLVQKYPAISGHVSIELADATICCWPQFTTVATEAYLGPPLSKLPDGPSLDAIVTEIDVIIEKFLINLRPQLKKERRICLAVPAWRKADSSFIHLPVIAKLTDMGYNRFSFTHAKNEELVYCREGQIVCRELVVLTRR